MPNFPPIRVRQPRPHDLVDDPVDVCGVGTGFEARIGVRVRDATGAQLAQVFVSAGGTGIWGNYHALLPLGTVPKTPQGTLEVFGASGREGVEVGKVVVPIVFGRVLIDPYHGFAQHIVVPGDTLSALAQRFYGDASKWPRILEANRDQVLNPDRIFPGQELRIPR